MHFNEETSHLDPPLMITYHDPPRRSLNHAGAKHGPGLRRRRPSRVLRHWACGLSLSTSSAAVAGALFAWVTGASGLGLAGVLLAAGIVTTWLSAPGGGVGATAAAWLTLLALFAGLGQVDPLAGLLVWGLLCGALVVGVWRACR